MLARGLLLIVSSAAGAGIVTARRDGEDGYAQQEKLNHEDGNRGVVHETLINLSGLGTPLNIDYRDSPCLDTDWQIAEVDPSPTRFVWWTIGKSSFGSCRLWAPCC